MIGIVLAQIAEDYNLLYRGHSEITIKTVDSNYKIDGTGTAIEWAIEPLDQPSFIAMRMIMYQQKPAFLILSNSCNGIEVKTELNFLDQTTLVEDFEIVARKMAAAIFSN